MSSKSLVTDLRFRKTLKYTLAGVSSAGLTQVCLLFVCMFSPCPLPSPSLTPPPVTGNDGILVFKYYVPSTLATGV